MPVFEQGYRPYTGPVRRGSRALAIAWESFRPRLRWWIWLMMFPFLFWPYLVIGGFAYAILMVGVQPPPLPNVPDVAFARGDPFRRMISAIMGNSGTAFWEVQNDGFKWAGPVVVCAVACAGILAADRRTNALHLYFSRPVSRRDYLAGKVLVVCAFCAMLTLVPTLLLWLECAALQPSWDYVAGTWWVPFSVTAAALLYALWTSGLVLLLSSLLDRPVLIGTVAILSYIFLAGLGNALSRSMDDQRWLAMVPHYAIGAVTAPLFGLDVPEWLPLPLCLVTAVGFPALAYAVVVRRLRAVEVVT
jgi:hypothetical protein